MQTGKEGLVLFVLFPGVLVYRPKNEESSNIFKKFLPYRIYFGEVQLNGLGEGMCQG